MNHGCPVRAFPATSGSDWLRNGHVTHAGPIRVSPGTLAVTLRKESGAKVARLSLPNKGKTYITDVSAETNDQ